MTQPLIQFMCGFCFGMSVATFVAVNWQTGSILLAIFLLLELGASNLNKR